MLVEDLLGAPAQITDLDSLRAAFPWVDRYHPNTLQEGLAALQRTCGSLILGQPPLAKAEPDIALPAPSAFEAARWLFGATADPAAERQALVAAGGDSVKAALVAAGHPDTPDNRRSVSAWMRAVARKPAELGQIDAKTATGDEPAAAEVDEAARSGAIRRAARDVLVAQGPAGAWLLRPTDRAGRGAAFWEVARSWGLGHFVPQACAVTLDGEPYLAERPTPSRYSPLDSREGRNAPRMALLAALSDGSLHRLAILDYVLGNPDRHAGTVLVDDRGGVLLAKNEGSLGAFEVSPEVFRPAYMTAWGRWPEVGAAESALAAWLTGLRDEVLRSACAKRGIDFGPCLVRLERLRAEAARIGANEAIRQAWAA
jgi:hypothetical protein